jgi:hypothetical protein
MAAVGVQDYFFVTLTKVGVLRNSVNTARLDSGFHRNDGLWANLIPDRLNPQHTCNATHQHAVQGKMIIPTPHVHHRVE